MAGGVSALQCGWRPNQRPLTHGTELPTPALKIPPLASDYDSLVTGLPQHPSPVPRPPICLGRPVQLVGAPGHGKQPRVRSLGREELPEGAALRQRASCSSGHSTVPIGRVTVLGQSYGKHQELPATCLQGLGGFSLPPCPFFLAPLHRTPHALPSKRARARRGSGAAPRHREGGHRKAWPSRKSSETAGGLEAGLPSSESRRRTPETPAAQSLHPAAGTPKPAQRRGPPGADETGMMQRGGNPGLRVATQVFGWSSLPHPAATCLFPPLPPPKWPREQWGNKEE